MAPRDAQHDGRLVGAIASLTANGGMEWKNQGDDRYTGSLDGRLICHIDLDDDGQPVLYVGRRKVEHASVTVLFDTVEGPFASRIKTGEQQIIDRAQQ
jgi:hypothetical protein